MMVRQTGIRGYMIHIYYTALLNTRETFTAWLVFTCKVIIWYGTDAENDTNLHRVEFSSHLQLIYICWFLMMNFTVSIKCKCTLNSVNHNTLYIALLKPEILCLLLSLMLLMQIYDTVGLLLKVNNLFL